MKKKFSIFVIVILLCCSLSFVGCSNSVNVSATDREYIERAIEIIKQEYVDLYSSFETKQNALMIDKHTEIKNTRIVWIKENDKQSLENVKCVVLFSILSNFFNDAPYYWMLSEGNYSSVTFYKDGTTQNFNAISRYQHASYEFNSIEYIEKIVDYEDAFNGLILK